MKFETLGAKLISGQSEPKSMWVAESALNLYLGFMHSQLTFIHIEVFPVFLQNVFFKYSKVWSRADLWAK